MSAFIHFSLLVIPCVPHIFQKGQECDKDVDHYECNEKLEKYGVIVGLQKIFIINTNLRVELSLT
jgi:hypothetical protein